MYDKTPYVWSTKFTPVKKKFTQPLVVMVETFRMSAFCPCLFWFLLFWFLLVFVVTKKVRRIN